MLVQSCLFAGQPRDFLSVRIGTATHRKGDLVRLNPPNELPPDTLIPEIFRFTPLLEDRHAVVFFDEVEVLR